VHGVERGWDDAGTVVTAGVAQTGPRPHATRAPSRSEQIAEGDGVISDGFEQAFETPEHGAR
jgi:hypothetical protein